ncbi:MAG TPA: cyclic beta 1-2 glucan synthetase, partial [Pirellulales bacterium]
ERMPHAAPLVQPDEEQVGSPLMVREESLPKSRRLRSVDTPHPRIHLYSNGHYSVMLTAAGGGSSTCDGIDATRWKEDATCDAWGQFCYIQDLSAGMLWSTGHQPICRRGENYEVTFSTDKAELRRRDGQIETLLEVTVSPESPVEVRRITLTNHDNSPHEIQLTSYAEIALAPRAADAAHPAFSKLFIETEYVPSEHAILCRRRPRSASDKPIFAMHVVAVDGPTTAEVEHETDRKRFLGRGRSTAHPWAIDPGNQLTGTTGPVLDPIVSLRERVLIAPGASISVAFSTAVVTTREEALSLADQYHDFHAVTRAFELAWAQSQVQLRQLTITDDDVHLFQRLAAHVVFAGNTLSASPEVLKANRIGQSGLWRFGISGDKPIVLAHIGPTDDLSLVRQLLLAHGYWRLLGFSVDLVILNEHPGGYFEDVQHELQELVRGSESHDLLDKPGGIFLRKGSELSPEDTLLLQAAARVVLASNRGTLERQVDRQPPSPLLPRPLIPTALATSKTRLPTAQQAQNELEFANGYGGFSADGREYVIARSSALPEKSQIDRSHNKGTTSSASRGAQDSAALTPAPWVNVIANPRFGTIVTESGGGYTWNENSQLNRLTTWSNDPVSDPPSEIVYLRDDTTGEFWTTTPAPLGDPSATVHHGQGYTRFESNSHGLEQELLIFVPQEDPLKIVRLTLRNRGAVARSISAISYTEWVLGTLRERARLHVMTEIDPESEAIFATNAFRDEFSRGLAFADVDLRPRTVTGDRMEFIGRNGSLEHPAALRRMALSDRAGAGLDPCAALMVSIELAPGEEKSVAFLLGEAEDRVQARRLLSKFRDPAEVTRSFDAVRHRWRELLSVIEVKTPDRAFDLMMNQWLLYQVLSCRLWGRSGFYQSGGAFGFRDQLQDCMALVYAAPAETRSHLLRAASRQFLAGDVQHWWHPPSGRGVRTRCSDDFLWLPFAALQYAARTGDATIWDEQVPYLNAPELTVGQDEDYSQPSVSTETGAIYEHCARAIERGFQFGGHGLPLMGSGDWNDGMNRVGAEGKGESVWNAWFQITILRSFAELARSRGDDPRVTHCLDIVQKLKQAIDAHAWDGAWYLRAFFDDGTPLGSTSSQACQIDSIAQSWAVISGAGDKERTGQAMDKVQEILVRQEDRMILLFTPPFNHDSLDPGYIKGYVPGIRENGGQYTHAATWVVLATAMRGQGDRAVELFGHLNPIHHGDSAAHCDEYQIEPYAIAGDVYGEPPHRGRGGWSWYTGAAGWLYRVGLESILGFQLHGNRLRIEPCVASHWSQFQITYRYCSSSYEIRVVNPRGAQTGVRSCTVDGQPQPADIELQDDGRTHVVEIEIG